MKILLCGANGYIGSLFYQKYFEKYNIFPIDNLLIKRKKLNFVKVRDYKDLNKDFINTFDVCIWLCGHSSVLQSINAPNDAFNNNVLGLIEFKKNFKGTLIYASSGSVYNNLLGRKCSEKTKTLISSNIYDFSKSTIDKYFTLVEKNFISLRFGTVVGASQCFRNELLLNKMSEDAIVKKKIFLSNPNKHRPILYINDLIKSLDLIVENHKDLRNEIFNLCSVNETMNNYANYVKNFFKIKIIRLENSNAYSFQMTNTKFIKFTKFVFTTNIETILQNIKNYLLFSKF